MLRREEIALHCVSRFELICSLLLSKPPTDTLREMISKRVKCLKHGQSAALTGALSVINLPSSSRPCVSLSSVTLTRSNLAWQTSV
ncbi:hypothetical protein MHYP_G00062340 [Metynnis hypsauchen]